MPKKPKTLEEALVALDRLETVVDRLVGRVDDLADDHKRASRRAREGDDTSAWLMNRTDELGETKLGRKQVAAQMRLATPQQVERVRVRGKVVTRIKRA